MTHFPCMTGNLEKKSLKQCTCNLFGHTHQTTNFYNDLPFMYHVGVDSHDGYPVNLDIIIEQMNAKVREYRSYLDEEETPAPVERKSPDFPARLTQKKCQRSIKQLSVVINAYIAHGFAVKIPLTVMSIVAIRLMVVIMANY